MRIRCLSRLIPIKVLIKEPMEPYGTRRNTLFEGALLLEFLKKANDDFGCLRRILVTTAVNVGNERSSFFRRIKQRAFCIGPWLCVCAAPVDSAHCRHAKTLPAKRNNLVLFSRNVKRWNGLAGVKRAESSCGRTDPFPANSPCLAVTRWHRRELCLVSGSRLRLRRPLRVLQLPGSLIS